ncbi:MAG: hypothetical protein QM398_02260 [Thermoproteota archaeon]|nr:hypothetical protein [Thermoproteota archaeon]
MGNLPSTSRFKRQKFYAGLCIIALVAVAALAITAGYSTLAKPSVDELLSAPEQIEIENRQYVLEPSLGRDFMPKVDGPSDGGPLTALIRITATDQQDFPSSISLNRLWVIKSSEEVWETTFTNETITPPYDYQLEKTARDGPKWDTNSQVDVVVEILHENNVYLLKASNQTIYRLV